MLFFTKICMAVQPMDSHARWPCARRRRSTCAHPKELSILYSWLAATSKSFWVPVGLLQAAFADVLEEFVNRGEQNARAIRVHPHFKIEFVVEEMNVAVAEHAEEFSGGFEILGVNDSLL